MKKYLLCCIFAGFMSVGTVPYAHAEQCTTEGLLSGIRCKSAVQFNPALQHAKECIQYCVNGEWIYGAKSCMADYYKLDEYSERPGFYRRCVDAKTACDASDYPAEWRGNNCYCGGNTKVWSGDELKCIESEDYVACTKDKNARWDNGSCFCVDGINYHWDSAQHKCVQSANQIQCEQLVDGVLGNGALKGKVRWDSLNHLCKCIVDANENPDDYYITNVYTCEKLPSVQRRENFIANTPAADARLKAIQKKITELKGISDNFNLSHWKNADGGFNTARLASDSVAGVVLGTVGGVITSNIIKKNQIKGGFEGIHCVIGGQRVAGFADQFNVGIQ